MAVEASGAEVCAQMAMCVMKADGTCRSSGGGGGGPAPVLARLQSRSVILAARSLTLFAACIGLQAGLGSPLTAVPLFTLPAREPTIRGQLASPFARAEDRQRKALRDHT